jgi:plasminogen activator
MQQRDPAKPMCSKRPFLAVLIGIAVLFPGAGTAADLFKGDAATLLRTERMTIEAFGGYLTGQGREYVSNAPFSQDKLSQLNWRIDNAFVVGGRMAVTPIDGLTLRARGWIHVKSDTTMDDYDWLAGYLGFNSWTHWSHHPDTQMAKGWQGDISAAYRWYEDEDLVFTAIGGYRYMTMKWNAYGGSFIYSTFNFYDTVGTFTPGELGIAYQQWWSTPYAGLGVIHKMGAFTFTGEIIASPWAYGHDKDYHAQRVILFKEDFRPTTFFAASLGAEYQYNNSVSFTGRAEYQGYGQASGPTKLLDGLSGNVLYFRKPSASADAETVLLSLGVKTRL